jgi:hypothetical protein
MKRFVDNQNKINALWTEAAIKEKHINPLSMSAIDTKSQEKQAQQKNFQSFLTLNPKLSADFYKMTRKKKRDFNNLQISNDEKTNSNKPNDSLFNDNELEFPSRDIVNYDLNDLNIEFNKPKKVVNVLTLD